MLRILYFAWLRDRLGTPGETLPLQVGAHSVQDLIDQLRARGGAYGEIFAKPELIRVAVNQSFATIDAPIAANDEIAFFPPVTGG
ncbi:molybdopterin converting factor subunit 1 [Komagataeibacter diospyri]|uniref:Molybdopterin converting factor small subunit n=1 Tax=Komagataeibacter diospyri TaxID=1932662 RepID=A0A4P5NTL6_9PROT|nr:molybdopterin converting factor subunit 1 [Komagataeibacter diospyri]GCE82875.1 molybdopterin converting factor small subunit [Komagataeibacter diospyri]GCE89621.1 molybdopterin converting factor small subunit [Komagataeibacter diospyri]